MAYFRCGGGGMPAGLQSGMDAVLNKKFGTSTTYPASGWPDNVNLLGPLPIIISNKAPIVSFNDGADDVPISEGTFYIAPSQSGTGTPSPSNPRPIVGYTGMTINQTGKNLIKPDKYQASSSILDIGQTDNTSFGTFLKAGTYTISYAITSGSCYIYRREQNDTSNTNLGRGTSKTFTIDKDGNYRFWLYGDDAVYANVSDVLLEVGSSVTTYTAYTAPETLAVSWQTEAGTVYGGELNVTTGVLTVTHEIVTDFSALALNGTSSTGAYRYTLAVSGMSDYNVATCISNILKYRVAWNADANEFYNMNNTLAIFLSIDNEADARTFLASNSCQIVYPLATPVTYQLDPHAINTFYGANNFYCDTGDSQLNYRADISLYINNH